MVAKMPHERRMLHVRFTLAVFRGLLFTYSIIFIHCTAQLPPYHDFLPVLEGRDLQYVLGGPCVTKLIFLQITWNPVGPRFRYSAGLARETGEQSLRTRWPPGSRRHPPRHTSPQAGPRHPSIQS